MATPDGDLRIRVEVPGESFKSLADLESWLKKERKAVKELDTASQEFANRSKQLSGVLDEKTRISKAMWSTNAKMKDSYFVLGEEIRRKTLPLMGQLNSLAFSAQGGIRGMASAAVMSVSSFSRLSGQVGGLGNAFKAMGGMLLGPGGIILAISGLALAFGDDLIPKIETATDRLKKFTEALKEAAKEGFAGINAQTVREEMETYDERVRIAKEQEKALKDEIKRLAGKVDFQIGMPVPTDEELTKINTRLTKAGEELMHLEKFRIAQEEYAKAARAALGVLEQQEAVKDRDYKKNRGEFFADPKDFDWTAFDVQMDTMGVKIDGAIDQAVEKGLVAGTESDKVDDAIKKLSIRYTDGLASGIASAFVDPLFASEPGTETDRRLQEIQAEKTKEDLRKQLNERKIDYEEYTLRVRQLDEQMAASSQSTFQRIGTAFESMGMKMLNIIADLAAEWLVLQLLMSLPLGPISAAAAVVSAGKFGKADGGPVSYGSPYIVGERGPEVFVPNQSGMIVPNEMMQSRRDPFVPNLSGMSRGGGMQGPVVLETVIRGNDIVLVQAKASRQRDGRTM